MIAFHGDETLRAKTIAQMAAHAKADQIVQGRYWQSDNECACGDGDATFRGCAVGCLTHDPGGGHHLYPTRWGIPEVLARLEDRVFDGLPAEQARLWPCRFLGAIPCGADLSMVWPRFALALLTDPVHGVVRHTREGSAQRSAVDGVAALLRRQIAGDAPSVSEWIAARRIARAADAAASAAAAAYAASAATDHALELSKTIAAAKTRPPTVEEAMRSVDAIGEVRMGTASRGTPIGVIMNDDGTPGLLANFVSGVVEALRKQADAPLSHEEWARRAFGKAGGR